MSPLTRRSFLRTAAWAGAASAFSARSWGQVAGSQAAVRVAVVGLGGGPLKRGQEHLKYYRRLPGVRVVALCDVDSAILDREMSRLPAAGPRPDAVRDVRRLLDRPDIDVISIATPNHWHALLGIWACQAGKDVYVEKPVSHELWEGRQLVHAASRYGRVVQAGTQLRSNGAIREAVAYVRAGRLGPIRRVRAVCFKRRPSIGLTQGPQPIPATVDYNLWLGPAPLAPLRRRQFHYDWHWFWATGNGEIGNTGPHLLDVGRWFLGEPSLPRRVLSVGGRLGYVDDGQTANTEVVVYDYAAAPLLIELRGLPARTGGAAMDTDRGASQGIIVECEGGSVVSVLGRATEAFDSSGRRLRSFGTGGDFLGEHFRNFLDCVRRRDPSSLHCPIAEGHVSTGLAHLANISYRLGRAAPPGAIRERLSGQPELGPAFGRMAEHLARNGVDLERTPAAYGEPLVFDPAAEHFPGNAAANALLTREDRAPFVVPRVAPA